MGPRCLPFQHQVRHVAFGLVVAFWLVPRHLVEITETVADGTGIWFVGGGWILGRARGKVGNNLVDFVNGGCHFCLVDWNDELGDLLADELFPWMTVWLRR